MAHRQHLFGSSFGWLLMFCMKRRAQNVKYDNETGFRSFTLIRETHHGTEMASFWWIFLEFSCYYLWFQASVCLVANMHAIKLKMMRLLLRKQLNWEMEFNRLLRLAFYRHYQHPSLILISNGVCTSAKFGVWPLLFDSWEFCFSFSFRYKFCVKIIKRSKSWTK